MPWASLTVSRLQHVIRQVVYSTGSNVRHRTDLSPTPHKNQQIETLNEQADANGSDGTTRISKAV